MAHVPLPGRAQATNLRLPAPVTAVLGDLAAAGHEAALVGGCVRDLVRGVEPGDWDVATSAPPEVVADLFPDSTWVNPYGTVTVRSGPMTVEVTTYRTEAGYRDARHPSEVRWGTRLEDDLERRDFTINAVAWVPDDLAAGRGHLADPYGGQADLAAGVLRAVGDPEARFAEDALRLLRAVRFATTLNLTLDPATEAAILKLSPAAASLSGERVRDELLRLLGAGEPSRGFALMERLGLLGVVLHELAALRGVEQGKVLGGDALDHSLRTVDALPASNPILRLAGLLHDVGKASTAADGHFIGHEAAGAELVEERLRALAFPRAEIDRITHLVRHHLIQYTPDWTDAAVRRFLRRVGVDQVDALLALRRADTAASVGAETRDRAADELERRLAALRQAAVLSVHELAVNGDDLIGELGLAPGPEIGRILDQLLQVVLEDPARNERDTLLAMARAASAGPAGGAPAHHNTGPGASESA
ncbi:MAG: CCA tRNA nucleotidyltransferase [Candidatus Limnocylindria bacterium]